MYFWRRYAAIAPLAVAISFLAVSCGESKISQCRKIVNVVNKTNSSTKAATNNGKKKDVNTILAVAKYREQAAQNLKTVKLSDTKLQALQINYATWYANTSAASRNLVNALKKEDETNVDKSLKNLRTHLNKESNLVNSINSYCQEKS